VRQLEAQLQEMSLATRAQDDTQTELIRSLQDQVNSWKQKYEALARLYAQLRKEHLDLLGKFKGIKDSHKKEIEEAKIEAEKLKTEGEVNKCDCCFFFKISLKKNERKK